jgi:hypothetical protein
VRTTDELEVNTGKTKFNANLRMVCIFVIDEDNGDHLYCNEYCINMLAP